MQRRTFLHALAAGIAAAKVTPAQVGANTAITGYGMVEAIALLRQIGFPAIEVHTMGKPEPTPGAYPGFVWAQLPAPQKQSILAALQGVPHVTAHLPYNGHDYFARDPQVAAAAVQVVDQAIESAAAVRTEVAVLHPKAGAGQTPDSQWPAMLERFRRWGDLAQAKKMRIALETGYPASVKDFVRLVKEVNHPAVGATLDVGHQSQYAELTARVTPEQRPTAAGIRAYNDINLALAEALGPKLFHFHIHDIEPATWKEHHPLVHGFIDYPRLFAQLNRMKYSGYLIFEIGGDPAKLPDYLRDGKRQIEQLL